MTNWDRSSKADFNKAAADQPSKDGLTDKLTGSDDTFKSRGKRDRPELNYPPPRMGSTRWDMSRAQGTEWGSPSKDGPAPLKEDPKLSKNFNNRAKG
ncbi:hypothetical protein [Neorhizobium sp. LjRoot104]|uniref:hypothetical protein n=1 Tax=Neorhizobium sp. LjRoot104 TaxID=3342254 RepID=UPI003ECE44AA